MKGQLKTATGLDNSISHKTKRELAIRQIVEESLTAKSRALNCPPYLTIKAKKEWERIKAIDDAREMPIIYDSDTTTLEILCELKSAWTTCQINWKRVEKIKAKTIEEKLKYFELATKIHAEMRKLGREIESLYSKFGLTPLGRSRFGSIKTKADNESDDTDFF